MKYDLRSLAGSVALAALCVTAASAQSSDQGAGYVTGPYVGAEGGANFLNNVSPHGGGADANSHFGPNYVFLGNAGYGFGNGFRVELEGGHRYNGLESVAGAPGGNHSGSLGMTTAIVNGIYDIDVSRFFGIPNHGFMPHVGLGVGWAQTRLYDPQPYNGEVVSGKSNLVAYQGIVGVDYALRPRIKLTLDYKVLATHSGNFEVQPSGLSTRSSFTDQAVLIGARYEFGAPPAEVAEAPPPPPPPPAPAPAPAATPEPQRSFQVFFDFDKSDITDQASQTLQQAAQLAQQGHEVKIKVTGHTDTVGTAEYNQKLSERRADAVKVQLISDGLSDSEIDTLGVGKTDLLVPTPDGVREPQNRRATIEFESNSP